MAKDYEISPLQHSELDAFIKLRLATFEAAEGSINQCFFPNGSTPSIHSFLRSTSEKKIDDPNFWLNMIRDPTTKELLGCSAWEVQHGTKSIDDILKEEGRSRQERETMPRVDGLDHAAFNESSTLQEECYREIVGGKPHVYVHTVAVSPQHQGRGVGSALMKWGLAKADELGLPVYLEGSQAGIKLYERCGFVVKTRLPFDARAYGHKNSAEHYCMLREAP